MPKPSQQRHVVFEGAGGGRLGRGGGNVAGSRTRQSHFSQQHQGCQQKTPPSPPPSQGCHARAPPKTTSIQSNQSSLGRGGHQTLLAAGAARAFLATLLVSAWQPAPGDKRGLNNVRPTRWCVLHPDSSGLHQFRTTRAKSLPKTPWANLATPPGAWWSPLGRPSAARGSGTSAVELWCWQLISPQEVLV